MAKIGSLWIEIAANSAKFRESLKKTRMQTQTWAKRIKSFVGGVAKRFGQLSLVVGATAGTLLALYKSQANAIDRVAKNAAKLGDVTAAFQAVKAAADFAGVGQGVETAMQRLVRRMSEAAQGTGEALKATAELGLDPVRIASLRASEQLQVVLDALHEVPDAGDRVRLAFKFFDTEGVGLVNLTSQAIRDAREEMDRWGATVTEQQAAWVQSTNDQLTRLGQFVRAAGTQFSVNLAPYIGLAAEKILDLAESFISWKGIAEFTVNAVRKGWVALMYAIDGVRLSIKALYLSGVYWFEKLISMFAWFEEKAAAIANIVPGVNYDASTLQFAQWRDSLREHYDGVYDDAQDLATRLLSVDLFGLEGSVYAGELDANLTEYIKRSEAALRKQTELQRAMLEASNHPMYNPPPLFDPSSLSDTLDEIEDLPGKVDSATKSARQRIVDGFVGMAKGTKDAMKDMVNSILEQFARLAIENALFGGDRGKGIEGFLGNLFNFAVGAPPGATAANEALTAGAPRSPIPTQIIVNAPNATPGTVQQVRSAARAIEDNAVNRAVVEQRRRAG